LIDNVWYRTAARRPGRIREECNVIVRLRDGLLVVTGESGDTAELLEWSGLHEGQVFRLQQIEGGSIVFRSLGPEETACRVPINIQSQAPAPLDLISNFAATPFHLDRMHYGSIEGFWQGLKFPRDNDRRRIAMLDGGEAKRAGDDAPAASTIVYQGEEITVGTFAHWQLMERACRAKFGQNEAAREALLSTGERPLEHRVRRDSRTIPGVIMAEIWMQIRSDLRRGKS
jgi:predicted NAD-dependent protein-ADP-ribosyltransferase YbiA (DUF1768 family)